MIDASFLAELASYVNGEITKLSLNSGAHEITDFELKEVDQSTVEMEYLIPIGSVAEVTLIELKNSSDETISSNAVYVPITADTIIRHTIQLKEV